LLKKSSSVVKRVMVSRVMRAIGIVSVTQAMRLP